MLGIVNNVNRIIQQGRIDTQSGVVCQIEVRHKGIVHRNRGDDAGTVTAACHIVNGHLIDIGTRHCRTRGVVAGIRADIAPVSSIVRGNLPLIAVVATTCVGGHGQVGHIFRTHTVGGVG